MSRDAAQLPPLSFKSGWWRRPRRNRRHHQVLQQDAFRDRAGRGCERAAGGPRSLRRQKVKQRLSLVGETSDATARHAYTYYGTQAIARCRAHDLALRPARAPMDVLLEREACRSRRRGRRPDCQPADAEKVWDGDQRRKSRSLPPAGTDLVYTVLQQRKPAARILLLLCDTIL